MGAGVVKPMGAIDFDGTITTGPQDTAKPVPDLVARLTSYAERYQLVIFSARAESNEGVQHIQQWLNDNGLAMIPFTITDRKPQQAVWILDDRGINMPGTLPPVEDLLAFRPWWGSNNDDVDAMPLLVGSDIGDYAAALRARAEYADGPVTAAVKNAAEMEGASLVGLNEHLKEPHALEGKLQHVMDEKGLTLAAAAADIKDALRYTVVSPDTESYTHVVDGVLRRLEAAGCVVSRIRNYWLPVADARYSDGTYRGINAILTGLNWFPFEVQFHTRESFDVRAVNWGFYVLLRSGDAGDDTAEIERQMIANYEFVRTPPGALYAAVQPPYMHRGLVLPAWAFDLTKPPSIPDEVHYRRATDKTKACATCSYFEAGACTMFPDEDGNPAKVLADATCDKWTVIQADHALAAALPRRHVTPPTGVHHHNQVLFQAYKRVDELEDKLTAVLEPLLTRFGEQAATAFTRYATDHMTAAATGASGWSSPSPNEIINAEAVVAALRTKTDPVRMAVVESVMKPTLEGAGITFDVTNPFTRKVLTQSGSQITHIAETTQLNVMRIIRHSYDQGLSIPDTAKAIRVGMTEASPARARLIARTELVGAAAGGSLAATQIVADATGVQYLKKWMTAPGARYPRHELYPDLDGQTQPLDMQFDVGGSLLQFPGDPEGPPEDVCNCRCTLEYVDSSQLDTGATVDPSVMDAGAAVFDGPMMPPPGDDISVPGQMPVPSQYIQDIRAKGLDKPISQAQPSSEFGKAVFGEGKPHDTFEYFHNHATNEWTQDREAIHNEILAKLLHNKHRPTHFVDGKLVDEKPTMFFTAGGGASGKGSLRFTHHGHDLGTDELGKRDDTVLIDPDAIKTMLPEYKTLAENGDAYAANAVHEESSWLAKEAVKEAQKRHLNVVLDTTGSNGSFVNKLEAAHDSGYTVKVAMASAPTNTAIVRAMERGYKTGRFVNINALKDAHRGASWQLKAWAENPKVDEWRLYDTTGAEGKLVASGEHNAVGSTDIHIFDSPAYDRILAKSDEGRVEAKANPAGPPAGDNVSVPKLPYVPADFVKKIQDRGLDHPISEARPETGVGKQVFGDKVEPAGGWPESYFVRPAEWPEATKARVEEAAATIKQVMPLFRQVRFRSLPENDYATARAIPAENEDVPPSIGIHPTGSPPTLNDIVHEYGHTLDRDLWGSKFDEETLPVSDRYGSELSSNEANSLWQTLRESPTMQALKNGEYDGILTPVERNQFLSGREMFARAYDQYIAETTRNPDMLAHIDSILAQKGTAGDTSFQYWTHNEFAPIQAQMTQLFKDQGLVITKPQLDTEAQYFNKETKKWADEREALHNDIIAKFFKGKKAPVGIPQAMFTAGGGAAGKGSLRFMIHGKRYGTKELSKRSDTVLIDPDLIKKEFPEYKQLTDAGDQYAASGVHEESSYLAKALTEEAYKRGLNIVLDTTGQGFKFRDKLVRAYNEGYNVQVEMASVPTNEAITRSIVRAEDRTGDSYGRYVNIQALKEAHAGASEALKMWMDMPEVSAWRLHSSSSALLRGTDEQSRVIAEGGKGAIPKIHDPNTWQDTLDKADEATHPEAPPKPAVGFQTGPVIKVGKNIELAAQLLAEGKRVDLAQPKQVSVLLDKIAKIVEEAKARGDDAPNFDLCNVTVKGTNLFCVQSKGIARVAMPQMKGEPVPGSRADRELEKNAKGRVSLDDAWRQHLAQMGVKITPGTEKASFLRATQRELVGSNVARIAHEIEGGRETAPIFVSRDNYVLDGHHQWAANIGAAARKGRLDPRMKIERIDLPITKLLEEANKFVADWGMKQQTVTGEAVVVGRGTTLAAPQYMSGDTFMEHAAEQRQKQLAFFNAGLPSAPSENTMEAMTTNLTSGTNREYAKEKLVKDLELRLAGNDEWDAYVTAAARGRRIYDIPNGERFLWHDQYYERVPDEVGAAEVPGHTLNPNDVWIRPVADKQGNQYPTQHHLLAVNGDEFETAPTQTKPLGAIKTGEQFKWNGYVWEKTGKTMPPVNLGQKGMVEIKIISKADGTPLAPAEKEFEIQNHPADTEIPMVAGKAAQPLYDYDIGDKFNWGSLTWMKINTDIVKGKTKIQAVSKDDGSPLAPLDPHDPVEVNDNEMIPPQAGLLPTPLEGHGSTMSQKRVAGLIDNWAATSSDSDKWALALQHAAADEFGMGEAAYKNAQHSVGMVSASDGEATLKDADVIYEAYGPALRAFVRAQYENTQSALDAAGVGDTITVYRGQGFKGELPTQTWSEQNVTFQPMSSFASTLNVAKSFVRYPDPGFGGIVATEVPRSRIMATARTGFGCLNEQECVILGPKIGETDKGILAAPPGLGRGASIGDITDGGEEVFWARAQAYAKGAQVLGDLNPDTPFLFDGKWWKIDTWRTVGWNKLYDISEVNPTTGLRMEGGETRTRMSAGNVVQQGAASLPLKVLGANRPVG